MSDIRPKILIIDDNEAFVVSLVANLVDAGYETVSALDGSQGLQKALSEKPDIIILDVMLPDANGFSLCAELRKNSVTARVPVMLITGDKTVDIEKGFEAGADDCVIKPIEPEVMITRLRRLLPGEREVLIVDDDRHICDMLSNVLSKNNMSVSISYNGIGLINHISGKRPDLILLDISLPVGPDGIELCRQLKTDAETRNIPIIMLSANDYADAIEKCFELGAEDYLFKPFNVTDLLLRIRKNIFFRSEKRCR